MTIFDHQNVLNLFQRLIGALACVSGLIAKVQPGPFSVTVKTNRVAKENHFYLEYCALP